MGNSASSLPFSVDQQVGAPHDHNGWALHEGKSKDSSDLRREVSVFVGKKPDLSKTPVDRRQPHKTQLEPALHHYEYCRKLRHPHILKVYATLDTDNPSAASISGPNDTDSNQSQKPQQSASSGTGDLIVVTEPCIPLSEWLLGAAASGPPTPEQLAWGLECVVEGLAFLHTSAKLAHGCVSPQSLYVTPAGDVKLWNFSLVTPVGPNTSTSAGGPDGHFLDWEAVCCPDTYRSPERREQRWDAISNQGGVHAMDSFSLGVLIGDYWFRNASTNVNNVPQTLQKALQRLATTNIKMRPRLQPLLKCPAFDTQYRLLQRSLQEISIQPVEQKINLWQNLGNRLQQTGVIPVDVAKYKILPLIITTILTICGNEAMLAKDVYRREVLAMLAPLFYIEEHYQDPDKVGTELAPLVAKLFIVPDRGVRSVLLNSVGFFTKALGKNALNSSVFEPLCSGFNDSSPVLRELTLKATQSLVPFLTLPNLEKLSRYLVRLQSDAESSLRTNAVIFISKIAPHMSDVSREKMLLPAFARSMKDPFSPCRLSALQSLMKSKSLFTKKDMALKVTPSVMPLLLDPMTDVRGEAFRVVRDLLEEIQEESNRMTELGDPPMVGAPGTPSQSQQQQPVTAPVTTKAKGTTPAPKSANSTSSGYLSGISSWMSTSSAGTSAPAPAAPAPAPAPAPLPTQIARPTPQPPVQQFAAASINVSQPTPIADDGWGDDDDDDDGWGDDDDVDDTALAFSNIGTSVKTHTSKPAIAPINNSSSLGGFGGSKDDDPFASLGMKTVSSASKPRVAAKKGKLALPKAQKPPPAKKLTMDSSEVSDGWDDF